MSDKGVIFDMDGVIVLTEAAHCTVSFVENPVPFICRLKAGQPARCDDGFNDVILVGCVA